MTHKIEVENIKCGGCMYSIKTALLKIENVTEVGIDKETIPLQSNQILIEQYL